MWYRLNNWKPRINLTVLSRKMPPSIRPCVLLKLQSCTESSIYLSVSLHVFFLSVWVWAVIVLLLKCFPPPLMPHSSHFFVWLCVPSLHPAPRRWQSSAATCSFALDVFDGAALIPPDDPEEVAAAAPCYGTGWSACRRDNNPSVHLSACSAVSPCLPFGNHSTWFGRLPHARSSPFRCLNSSSTHLSCDGLKGMLQPPPGLCTVIRCSEVCWQPIKQPQRLIVSPPPPWRNLTEAWALGPFQSVPSDGGFVHSAGREAGVPRPVDLALPQSTCSDSLLHLLQGGVQTGSSKDAGLNPSPRSDWR